MKKIVYEIIAILLLVSILTLALNIQQAGSSEPPETEWNRTYGGASADNAQSVVQTIDGGYAIAGQTESFGAGGLDYWLVKTDAYGNMQWNKTYGGASTDYACSVVERNDGGYAIAGGTHSFGAGNADFWLIKTDAAGNMEWHQTYGGAGIDWASHLVQTSDGGYILAGLTQSFGAGGEDCWLVKTDSSGNMQWNKTYGGTGNDVAKEVVETSDGGYAIACRTSSFGAGNYDFWLIKTDSAGNVEWSQTYGGPYLEWGRSVVQTDDGGYAIAGNTRSFGAGGDDCWLVKTDAAGNMQWNQTYGGTGHDHPGSLVQTRDGGYAMIGRTESFGAGMVDWWLVKTYANGTMEWNKTYGGTGVEESNQIIQTSDGGYAIAGWTGSFGAGNYDFWLIKLAPIEILATVDIDPDTLNLKSNGQWITAYITLPEGYNVEDIVLETVYLDGIPAVWSEIQDGVYMGKFDRATVQASLTNEPDYDSAPKFYDMTLAVTGNLVDGTPFEGRDTIRVLSK